MAVALWYSGKPVPRNQTYGRVNRSAGCPEPDTVRAPRRQHLDWLVRISGRGELKSCRRPEVQRCSDDLRAAHGDGVYQGKAASLC